MGRKKNQELELTEAASSKLFQMAAQTDDRAFIPEDQDQLIQLVQTEKLSRKIMTEVANIGHLSRDEIRNIVKSYYQIQDQRMALRSQQRAVEQRLNGATEGDVNDAETPKQKTINAVMLDYLAKNFAILEVGIKDCLGIVAQRSEVGRWLLQIVGIGPVLAAGCLAYFDVRGRKYASEFHSYAGLNSNNRKWLGKVGAEKIMNELLDLTRHEITSMNEKINVAEMSDAAILTYVKNRIRESFPADADPDDDAVMTKLINDAKGYIRSKDCIDVSKLSSDELIMKYVGYMREALSAKSAISGDKLSDADIIDNDFVIRFAVKTQWKYDYLMSKAFNADTGKWSKTDLIKAASKIPYNADLKIMMWKLGQSWKWNINNEKSLYGKLIQQRKEIETKHNEAGDYAEQAAEILRNKNIGKNTIAYQFYSKGMLPKAHINARCERWAVKIFISHLFEEMYRVQYNKRPPLFYPLVAENMGGQHNRMIPPEVPFYHVPEDDTDPLYVDQPDKVLDSVDSAEE